MHRRTLDKIKQALCFNSISSLRNLCVSRSATESLGTDMVHFIRRKALLLQKLCKDKLPGIHPWGMAGQSWLLLVSKTIETIWFQTVHLGSCLWLLRLLLWATWTLQSILVLAYGLSRIPQHPFWAPRWDTGYHPWVYPMKLWSGDLWTLPASLSLLTSTMKIFSAHQWYKTRVEGMSQLLAFWGETKVK